MKLNPKANAIRNLNLSENKKEDIEMKQKMIDVLKEGTSYKKDIEASKSKRERRANMQKLAGDDSEKLQKLRDVMYSDEEKSESKEQEKKIPKFESENHKIDKGLSKKEKLAQGWKEEERPAYIDGTETKIKVLKKELAPGAYVREYQDDGNIPAHLVGEQLFNWKAVLNLKLQYRLPTWDNMVTMRGDNHEEFMNKNFIKGDKFMFPGYWDPYNERFTNFGRWAGCWLSDGNTVALNKGNMNHNYASPEFGFSLRLLKN